MAKILVVDDNVDMLLTLEHLFNFYDFEVVKAENGLKGYEKAQEELPDLIILDALMPVMTGFEACGKLKSSAATKNIPIIFLSANYTSSEHRRRGMSLGADDYILKPFNAKELISKVNKLLQRKALIDKLRTDNKELLKNQKTKDQEIPVKSAGKEGQKDAITDDLTGLYNQDLFAQRLQAVYENQPGDNDDCCVAFLDVDHFQRINDTFGEHTGDYVLMRIANILLKNASPRDTVFRIEKNKFSILLANNSEGNAFYTIEKIRAAIQQTLFFEKEVFEFNKLSPRRKQSLQQITVSGGIAGLKSGRPLDETLKNAEEALNRAKANGKNVVVKYTSLVTEV